MEIYLVRHTKPDIKPGKVYGHTDLDVVKTFREEAAVVRQVLPAGIKKVYSSPLRRCRKLAEFIFSKPIEFHDDLKELNCGHWEMLYWDEIPQEELEPWMKDRVNVRVPGGESYRDLYERTVARYQMIASQDLPAVVIAHGGVLRSILSHVTGTSIADSFERFPLYYGCVAKIDTGTGSVEMVLNEKVEEEQHRPTRMFKQ